MGSVIPLKNSANSAYLDLRNLVNEGMTMLIVTHELGFASKFGDKIVFMDAGEIIESGPPNTILKSPKTERLKLFLEKLSLMSL